MKLKGLILIMIIIAVWGTWVVYQPHIQDEIIANDAVTEIKQLSEYYTELKGTNGDTDVYIFDSGNEGGTALIYGGSHANEVSGILASILMVESGSVDAGRVIVIPHTNASGIRNRKPLRGDPWRIVVNLENGENRQFRYGSRFTHPLHQWPDSYEYEHVSGEHTLNGDQGRNLNRTHPGKDSGILTEKISYGLFSLINKENVDLAFDLHEAGPESNIAQFIITHPKSMYFISDVSLDLQFYDYSFIIEQSNFDVRGLSHRELGEATDAYAILTETSNPYQGSYFVDTSLDTIISGNEPGYKEAMQRQNMNPDFDDISMKKRVASQLKIIQQSFNTLNLYYPEKEISFNFPDPELIIEVGIGQFLNSNN